MHYIAAIMRIGVALFVAFFAAMIIFTLVCYVTSALLTIGMEA